ncbi:hypothetical protein MTR_0376s0040 [Medicago truncatula]|uniref:Uncharacterized protein n=1 Tax=Medicago truncatula TaxID=3880 RepID=A0A072TFM5_MEDTR|nr:hypothetical protein MTR_0376s0040 [Medicago truncatula]
MVTLIIVSTRVNDGDVDCFRHNNAILQSYFIKRPKDISPVYEEGQIPSRKLMTLNMIHQVPINQRYGYPFTDNVRMETKYLSPHLGIKVVSGSQCELKRDASEINCREVNQVAWTLVARSSFQGRARGIPGSIQRRNNAWPVCMPLRTNRISRPPLMGQKPVRK